MNTYSIYSNGKQEDNVSLEELVFKALSFQYSEDALVYLNEAEAWRSLQEVLPILEQRLEHERHINVVTKIKNSSKKNNQNCVFKQTDSILTTSLKWLCIIFFIVSVFTSFTHSVFIGAYVFGVALSLAIIAHILSFLERRYPK